MTLRHYLIALSLATAALIFAWGCAPATSAPTPRDSSDSATTDTTTCITLKTSRDRLKIGRVCKETNR